MAGLRIIFMGTPEFAVPALSALLDSPHDVVAAYSQPPRPAGRGLQLMPSPVHQLAASRHIPVFTPLNFKSEQALAELAAHKADLAVVVAYGLLLPQAVLDSFPKGCINIHPSALPRWRGAAPIQRTILAGDPQTAICIMQMDAGLDTGAVLKRLEIPMPSPLTSGELHDMLAQKSAPLLLQTLAEIQTDTTHPIPQSAEGVTYAKKINKEEARLDWNLPATELERQIRGLNPFPIANALLEGETIKILAAEIVPNLANNPPPGHCTKNLIVQCGNGALRITRLQRPGKKPMDADEFLRGFALPDHARFL